MTVKKEGEAREELFPFLKTGVRYLDSAASTQKPRPVLDALERFYTEEYANVHRGLHRLAEKATVAYEGARKTVAEYLGAENAREIIFTSGTTEAMNLLASTFPLTSEDTVVLTELEHHSTLVPWQQAAKRAGATLRFIPVTDRGELDMREAERIIADGCTVLACVHLSNVTGTVQDIPRLAEWVHARGGRIFVDGAQALAHLEIDVKELGVDGYAVSGHKAYGPTGIGALYLRGELLEGLSPYRFGGEMVDRVGKEETTFANPPHRFEAGTPPIAQAVAMAAALEWLSGMRGAWENERIGVQAAHDALSSLDFVTVIGPRERMALVSFVVDGVHAHDVAQFLDGKGIAIRAGHHCTQVLHDRLGITASCRASFGLYNRKEDVDALVEALKECKRAFDKGDSTGDGAGERSDGEGSEVSDVS